MGMDIDIYNIHPYIHTCFKIRTGRRQGSLQNNRSTGWGNLNPGGG